MGAAGEQDSTNSEEMQGGISARKEKILVLVRFRPLSDEEIARNEVSDWECINETTILFRNSLHEWSLSPTAYTYGKEIIIYSIYEDTHFFQSSATFFLDFAKN